MENFPVPEQPIFDNEVRQFDIGDRAHASIFNLVIAKLFTNGLFNKKRIEELEDAKVAKAEGKELIATKAIAKLESIEENANNYVHPDTSTIRHVSDTEKTKWNSADAHTRVKTNPHEITKEQLGLGKVDDKSAITILAQMLLSDVTKALDYIPAELGADGKILSAQLPSYVDDVVEGKLSTFPARGEPSKIYVDTVTNKTYRWSGSQYAEISKSLAIGATDSTAGRGDHAKTAFDHTKLKTNPHDVTKAQVDLGQVDNTSDLNKPVSKATQALITIMEGEIINIPLSSWVDCTTDPRYVKQFTTTTKNNYPGGFKSIARYHQGGAMTDELMAEHAKLAPNTEYDDETDILIVHAMEALTKDISLRI